MPFGVCFSGNRPERHWDVENPDSFHQLFSTAPSTNFSQLLLPSTFLNRSSSQLFPTAPYINTSQPLLFTTFPNCSFHQHFSTVLLHNSFQQLLFNRNSFQQLIFNRNSLQQLLFNHNSFSQLFSFALLQSLLLNRTFQSLLFNRTYFQPTPFKYVKIHLLTTTIPRPLFIRSHPTPPRLTREPLFILSVLRVEGFKPEKDR
jgi:hypothetical protein